MTGWGHGCDGVRGRGCDGVGVEVGWGDGAVRVEIPATSAGMTGKGARVSMCASLRAARTTHPRFALARR